MRLSIVFLLLMFAAAVSTSAQETAAQRAALNEPAIGLENKSAAIEARLLTRVLNGSDEAPIMNAKLVVKNITTNFYTYVSGWATFYDADAIRCGEGLFKLDALAPQESAEVDTPGLRLHCAPATWRIVLTNLVTRTSEIAKPVATQTPPSGESMSTEKPAPVNFIISIDGEEHPIQVNNPLVLKLGNKDRKIVLRSAP